MRTGSIDTASTTAVEESCSKVDTESLQVVCFADEVLTNSQADVLASALDLELGYPGMCTACLGIVAIALDFGGDAELARALREMTPHLWADGLEEHALDCVRRACRVGTPDACDALAELEAKGGHSRVARAIVRGLATKLAEETRAANARIEDPFLRSVLGLGPAELN